jgi:Domain of unknown function (DUF4398)
MYAKLSEKTGQLTLYTALVLSLMVMACASGNEGAARKDIGGAELAMNQAQTSNAQQYAPLELKLAQNKLALAHEAFDQENYKEAQYRAQEAAADANLAESKSHNAKTLETVQALKDSIGQLRNQIEENQQAK